MDAVGFPCPCCQTTLRVRERQFIGRDIECPACHAKILIRSIEKGIVDAVSSEAAAASLADAEQANRNSRRFEGLVQRVANVAAGFMHFFSHPMAIAWTVTIACAALLAWGLLSEPAVPKPIVNQTDSIETPPTPVDPPEPNPMADNGKDDAESRLRDLGKKVADYRSRRDEFPASTPGGWSWLAVMMRPEDSTEATWNLGWQHSSQQRFVRRKVPELLVPGAQPLVGDDGYPTTHLVGFAGIGPDGPALPRLHPRAGIFGDVPTKTSDVRDGLGNTWLATETVGHLASWAAAGVGTARPLTAEPILHGPDGFGIRPDRMAVLLADGSVREISNSMDPKLAKSMIAIADIHLSEQDPSPMIPRPDVPVVADDLPPADALSAIAANLLASMEPPIVVWNSTKALAQPIISFEQPTPVMLIDFLPVLEDLVGAPIRYSEAELGLAMDGLQQKITFNIQDSTAGDLTRQVLKKCGFDYVVEKDHLRLAPLVVGPSLSPAPLPDKPRLESGDKPRDKKE